VTRTVHVLGRPHNVNVQRKYKSVWIAVGEYMGQRIEVRERTEHQVVAAWVAATSAQGS
jgi:hypothetical protein